MFFQMTSMGENATFSENESRKRQSEDFNTSSDSIFVPVNHDNSQECFLMEVMIQLFTNFVYFL